MTQKEIAQLKQDILDPKKSEGAVNKLIDELDQVTKERDTALELIEEQNQEIDKIQSNPIGQNEVKIGKKTYILKVPKFSGIPGYLGRHFTQKDLEDNDVKVDFQDKTFGLGQYLLKIKSDILTEKQ